MVKKATQVAFFIFLIPLPTKINTVYSRRNGG